MRPPSIPTQIPVNRDTDCKESYIMKTLYNTLINHKEPKSHRLIVQVFMCLPSRKDFPEYFSIIEKPISMNKIRDRIEKQLYPNVDSCMEDFKLMFSNCRFFNEEDSQIYNDAVTLENILIKRKDQLLNEFNRSSRDSKDSIVNNNSHVNDDTKNHQNHHKDTSSRPNLNNSHTYRSERLNQTRGAAANNSSYNTRDNFKTSPQKRTNSITNNPTPSKLNEEAQTSNNSKDEPNDNYKATSNHQDTSTQIITSHSPASPKKAIITDNADSNIDDETNEINTNDSETQQSLNATFKTDINGKNGDADEISEESSFNVIHNHHHETSMDSTSNLSADLIASTPIEKCSLNNRRGRNSEAPKRQLLTGYIIYASEIRKQVIDKHPNQNFGDISRLVGNEWKALPRDIRSKYDERALIHNKRVREKAQRELSNPDLLSNGFHTPKLTKRKLAKLAKEQMRQHHLSSSRNLNDSVNNADGLNSESSTPTVNRFVTPGSKLAQSQHQSQQIPSQSSSGCAPMTVDSATQTIVPRFVAPSNKRQLTYSETFRRYMKKLQVPNRDTLDQELGPERHVEQPSDIIGSRVGRHQTAQAALWALRDFMLQDAKTMRRSLQPYL